MIEEFFILFFAVVALLILIKIVKAVNTNPLTKNASRQIKTSPKGSTDQTDEDRNTYQRVAEYELKGIAYRGDEAISFIESLMYLTESKLEGIKLYLLREPGNEHDPWAVKEMIEQSTEDK